LDIIFSFAMIWVVYICQNPNSTPRRAAIQGKKPPHPFRSGISHVNRLSADNQQPHQAHDSYDCYFCFCIRVLFSPLSSIRLRTVNRIFTDDRRAEAGGFTLLAGIGHTCHLHS
jgi:hypothetical protein